MKGVKKNKTNERKENKSSKDTNDGLSSLMNLKIQNENIHIQNIIRTINYVYISKYDTETGFTYIKDILKNIVKGNVYDIDYKKYINEFCIYELSARILLNLIKVYVKDVNFSKLVDFLFDMLHYCDILLEEKKNKKSLRENSNQECNILVTRLWIRLLDNVFTKDKKQRINMCKVLRAYVKKACSLQIDVSDKLCKKHVSIILSLLNDKDHNVRSHCLVLLEPFQDSTTIASYLKCLDDAHFVVRITAIKNILINVQDPEYDYITILKNLLIRINDFDANVRESVYEKLKDYYYYIPPDMKYELLLCGLNDKKKSVNESCYSMIMYWTRLFNDKMEDLLSHMISSDIDNDVLLEQICRIHLSNVRSGNIKQSVSMLSREESRSGVMIKYNGELEEGGENRERDYTVDGRRTSMNEQATISYDEQWFTYCAEHVLELSPVELYMFRIYVEHFSEEQEREKIDLLQILRAIYYNVYVSRFNEKLFNYRKIFLSYTSTSPEDSLDYEHIRCECGLSKKDLHTIREEKKQKFLETSVFDETYCNKCIYFRSMLQVEPVLTPSNNENGAEKNVNEETNEVVNNNCNSEKVVEEHIILDEDNMNENYKYLCNVKNLLLICKCLEIIEIYQVEKIIKCCEFVLLKSPLREIILKCMLYHTGVNYFRLQKGHMSCAYWLSNTYVYACMELLKEMIYIKYEKCSVNEIEMNFSKAVLSIISEIKEPFDCTSDEKPLTDFNSNSMTHGVAIGEDGDEEEEREKEKKFNRAVRESNNDTSDTNSFHMIASAIMNVDNVTIFEIIRRDHLKALTIAQLSSVCSKMQGRLDVCEAKIKDLTEMEREKELEREKKEHGDQPNEEEQYMFHEQIRFHTQIFLKNITVLSMVRLELKRRWLRILFILECFLCKSKSHCTFDSALREFPNELLLPALYFCCTIMPNWDEKEIEDQFYDIIVSKCLGNWSMFIGNDQELLKQIKAYKEAISETCEVISNYLVNIERIHEAIFPETYTKVDYDNFVNLDNKGPTKIIINEEDGPRKEEEEDLSNVMYIPTNPVTLFYEYTPPTDHLLQFFKTNQNAWFEYKELLEKLEINTLRCEIYICVVGDLLMSHPHLLREEVIADAMNNLWNCLCGNVITNKYVQSICLRACCKLALIEYVQFNLNEISNEQLFLCMNLSATRLRALFEMCFLNSPATYNCVQDFKKISTFKITNINSHDKIFLLSFFSRYPIMTETNLFIFQQTFEEAVVKTSEGVLKHKLKTTHFSNMLSCMIFTILHKASVPFLMENFSKYIKWLLLIIIEKGFVLTHRSNMIELVSKIVQIYLSEDLEDINNLEKRNHGEKKEVKRRGRKRKVQPTDQERNNEKPEGLQDDDTHCELDVDQTTYRTSENNEKEIESKSTLCMKCAHLNVNATLKELRSMFILMNFCTHDSDILKSKNHIRYFEVLKTEVEKQIEDIKNLYVKNNWVVGSNQVGDGDSKCSNDKTGKVLLDLQKLEQESDNDIFNEIIQEYSNYVELIEEGSRDFAYCVIPNDIKNQVVEDELTKQEIMKQINDPNFDEQLLQDSMQKPKKRRRGRRRKSEVERERIMKERQNRSAQERANREKEPIEEPELVSNRKDVNKNNEQTRYDNNSRTTSINSTLPNKEKLEHNENETKMHDNSRYNKEVCESPSGIELIKKNEKNWNLSNNSATAKMYEHEKERNPQQCTNESQNNKIKSGKTNLDLELSSSNSDPSDEYTSEDESENEGSKDLKNNILDIDSDSSMSSNDSTKQTFKRLNRLKRTSYINLISK